MPQYDLPLFLLKLEYMKKKHHSCFSPPFSPSKEKKKSIGIKEIWMFKWAKWYFLNPHVNSDKLSLNDDG